jgi:hypothetical protein
MTESSREDRKLQTILAMIAKNEEKEKRKQEKKKQ